MRANIDLIEPEMEENHHSLGDKADETLLHVKDVKRKDRFYWSMAMVFAFVSIMGIGYIFGIFDFLQSGTHVEHKDYHAEEIANKYAIKTEQDSELKKLREENVEESVQDATEKSIEEEVAEKPAEPVEIAPQKKEEELIGEEF